MSMNFFAGRVEGQPFVAAQTLIPSEQSRAGIIVDSMTTRYGTQLPRFEKGWLARTIDPALPLNHVIETLEQTGAHVETVGEVHREDVERFLGPVATEQALSHPEN